MTSYQYIAPQITLFGYDSLQDIGEFIQRLHVKKGLIITDETLVEIGIVKMVTDVLDASQLPWGIFTGVKPNPTIRNVEDAVSALKTESCDYIISIGGGSAHDCAKAAGLTAANNCKVLDLADAPNRSELPSLPLVMINTTAGTASECTHAYVIVDEKTNRKFGVRDIHALASIAVDDHRLMMKLPVGLTAGTGMDALTHALESYVSLRSQPITAALGMAAIRLVFKWLPDATHKATEESREGMAVAQYLAGLSFGNASCGLVHSMSHQLSALYDLPHGLCNAILLPPVMRYNTGDERAMKLYAELARDIFPFISVDKSEQEQAELLIEEVERLSANVGTLKPLHTIGVKESDIPILADMALKDGSIPSNPRKPSKEEIMEIYKTVM
jgi:alcohol dehydrogenase